jgi:hypothetical protein
MKPPVPHSLQSWTAMDEQYETMLAKLEDGSLDPKGFSHRHHVGVTLAALHRYPFFKALDVVASGLEKLAIRAKVPERFHATLTLANFCLIAERMEQKPGTTPDEFMNLYPEVLTAELIQSVFPAERLASELARKVGLLPSGHVPEDTASFRAESSGHHRKQCGPA